MFDTPDIRPLCVAPFVAILGGVFFYLLVKAIHHIIRRKTGKPFESMKDIALLVSIILVPILCILSVTLRIGALSPAPWFEIKSSDIIGHWKLTKETEEFILRNPHLNTTIIEDHDLVFNADGTFYVKTLPSFWLQWGLQDKQTEFFLSGSGTWYLGKLQGTERIEQTVFAQFEEINGLVDYRTMRFYFENHLPTYKMITLDGNRYWFKKHK